jgi:hypothetical protein
LPIGTIEGERLVVAAGHVPNSKDFRRTTKMGIQKPLIRLLLSNHAYLATDPRDKAYALLGLASDGQELVPAPHYRQSVQCVLEDLIRAMLMSQGCANMAAFRSASRDPGRQSAILGPRLGAAWKHDQAICRNRNF